MNKGSFFPGIAFALLALSIGGCHVRIANPNADLDGLLQGVKNGEAPTCRVMAKSAVDDLIRNYWIQHSKGGEILPTWTGIPLNDMPDKRGGIWERGMMLFALDNYCQTTGDVRARRIIEAEAHRFKRIYRPEELEQAGALLHTAVDDCGWNAALYLIFFRYTKDPWMLDRAVNLLENTYTKWLDDTFGGGLWYRDEKEVSRRIKSIYAASIVLDSLDVWRCTGKQSFYDRAVHVYEWIHTKQVHPANIYFCDYNASGPLGKEHPEWIREAGSVTFLGGNMMMAVLHARMYALTLDAKYLERAKKTAQGILDCEVRDGRYLNDRDAWTNAAFMGAFVREVLPLQGVNQDHKAVLYKTARSIFCMARTPEGYYGGSWAGPADGPGSKWSAEGSIPKQIMTSATSVNVIISAAAAEKKERYHENK